MKKKIIEKIDKSLNWSKGDRLITERNERKRKRKEVINSIDSTLFCFFVLGVCFCATFSSGPSMTINSQFRCQRVKNDLANPAFCTLAVHESEQETTTNEENQFNSERIGQIHAMKLKRKRKSDIFQLCNSYVLCTIFPVSYFLYGD